MDYASWHERVETLFTHHAQETLIDDFNNVFKDMCVEPKLYLWWRTGSWHVLMLMYSPEAGDYLFSGEFWMDEILETTSAYIMPCLRVKGC